MKIFEAFTGLMEQDSGSILARYLDTSHTQMDVLRDAIARADFSTVHEAARLLESSSRQIGAIKLSGMAADLKSLSTSPSGGKQKLKAMIEQLTPVQLETEQFIARNMKAE
jgi:HPt (histidine-containing phosphotransfer) domain-containing protein